MECCLKQIKSIYRLYRMPIYNTPLLPQAFDFENIKPWFNIDNSNVIFSSP